MKKNQIVILISVLTSVAAAALATMLILKRLKRKNHEIAPATLPFANDFSEDDLEDETPAE